MAPFRRAVYLGLTFSLLYSLYLIVQQYAVRTSLLPLHLNFLSYLTALSLLVIYKIIRPRVTLFPHHSKGITAAVLTALLGSVIGDLAVISGLTMSSSINWSITSRLMPLVTVIFAIIILHQTITTRNFLGILVSILGVYIIIKPPSQLAINPGDLLFLVGLLAYSLGNITAEIALTHLSVLHYLSIRISVTALILGLSVAVFQPLIHIGSWFAIIFTGITIILGVILAGYTIKYSSAVFFALIGNVIPVFTIILSIFILHELPTPIQLVGGLITIAGIFLYYTKHHPPTPLRSRNVVK